VYSLPLLPGYGASTKIRSSPAVKSPGGVSLLERMTQAEDLGYDDSYFPTTNDDTTTQHQNDPSEYILSHSPPLSPMDLISAMDVPAGEDGEREREEIIGEMQERLESGDGLENVDEGLGLRAEDDVGVRFALDRAGLERRKSKNDEEESPVQTGTRMSPEHPGYLQHIPSTALTPSELSPPHVARYPHMKARPRRKSTNLNGKVAEAVFFSYGVSVFFGFQEDEERAVMEDCEVAGCWIRAQEEDDWDNEEFHYVVSHTLPDFGRTSHQLMSVVRPRGGVSQDLQRYV
jgi:hypothetical protein